MPPSSTRRASRFLERLVYGVFTGGGLVLLWLIFRQVQMASTTGIPSHRVAVTIGLFTLLLVTDSFAFMFRDGREDAAQRRAEDGTITESILRFAFRTFVNTIMWGVVLVALVLTAPPGSDDVRWMTTLFLFGIGFRLLGFGL